RVYDARGQNTVTGLHRPPLDTRPYSDFRLSDSTPYPRRDWGGVWRFRPWFTSGPEVGAVVGGGVVRYNFGVRKLPSRSRLSARVGSATGADKFRAELQGDFYRVTSRAYASLLLRPSRTDVI